MRLLAVFAAFAFTVAAQVAPPAQTAAPVAPPAAPPNEMGIYSFADLEKRFDAKIQTLDPADRFDLLGDTRGLYLDGYGAVFTVEVSLIVSPTVSPFTPAMGKPQIGEVRKRKLAHLPALQAAMREMMVTAARTLSAMPPEQKIVFAARLLYMPYEDTTGLPGMILMSADRASAADGKIEETTRGPESTTVKAPSRGGVSSVMNGGGRRQ